MIAEALAGCVSELLQVERAVDGSARRGSMHRRLREGVETEQGQRQKD